MIGNPGGGPGYGRYFKGKGGVVTIASKDGKRRVPIAPAFDPLAVSMVPIPGWKAGPVGVPAAGVWIPGSALYRTDMDGNPIPAGSS